MNLNFAMNQNGAKIWVLGIIDNDLKDFHILATKSRQSQIIKNFTTRYIQKEIILLLMILVVIYF